MNWSLRKRLLRYLIFVCPLTCDLIKFIFNPISLKSICPFNNLLSWMCTFIYAWSLIPVFNRSTLSAKLPVVNSAKAVHFFQSVSFDYVLNQVGLDTAISASDEYEDGHTVPYLCWRLFKCAWMTCWIILMHHGRFSNPPASKNLWTCSIKIFFPSFSLL